MSGPALGALVELPSVLTEPRPPLEKRVCARCDLVLGWRVCAPRQDGQISRGLCTACEQGAAEHLESWMRIINPAGAEAAAAQLAAEWAEQAPRTFPF